MLYFVIGALQAHLYFFVVRLRDTVCTRVAWADATSLYVVVKYTCCPRILVMHTTVPPLPVTAATSSRNTASQPNVCGGLGRVTGTCAARASPGTSKVCSVFSAAGTAACSNSLYRQ